MSEKKIPHNAATFLVWHQIGVFVWIWAENAIVSTALFASAWQNVFYSTTLIFMNFALCFRAKQLYRQDLLYHTNLVARSMGDVSKIGTSRHCTTPGNYSPQTPTRPLKFSRWKTIALPFEPRPFFRGTFVCFFRGVLPLIKSLWIFSDTRYKELILPERSSVGRF